MFCSSPSTARRMYPYCLFIVLVYTGVSFVKLAAESENIGHFMEQRYWFALLKPMTKHLLLWLLEHLGRLGEFQEDVITQRNRLPVKCFEKEYLP